MPGIVGLISKHFSETEEMHLQRMCRALLHKPFYVSGSYSNARMGLGVAWACHPDSFSDCLPIWNETRDICLVFTGEDFCDMEQISALRSKGHLFDKANGSYLVHLYEEEGIAFLDRLNGWFSGFMIDLRKGEAVLFNDRYGLNRLYYHEDEENLFFASEAKSILSVVPEARRLDPRGMAELCACGCALQNRTIFSGISLLPGASRWLFAPGKATRKEAFFVKEEWENAAPLGRSEFYEELQTTFRRVLPKYFRGKQEVGMSLTGGLDGRMIMAWADRPPGSLPCYTFGSSYRDCTDVTIARAVAKATSQSHRVISVGADFYPKFPELAEQSVYYSDGTMDVTGAVELYVNEIARQIAPVRLTGNYGSEILRGNIAFKPRRLNPELYDAEYLRLGESAVATYQMELGGNIHSFIAFKQVPWHHTSRLSVEQTQLTMRSPFLDNQLVALMYRAPRDLAVSAGPALRLISDGNPKLSAIPTDRGLRFRPVPVLTKAQNAYNEFTFKAEYAYDYGMPQWLARVDNLLRPFQLERIFLGRHKFHHFRVWYRDHLSRYLKEVLLDPVALRRPFFRKGALEKMVNHHVNGRRNYTSEIHQALTCELIQRQLIEKVW